jgi:hypothetical protein
LGSSKELPLFFLDKEKLMSKWFVLVFALVSVRGFASDKIKVDPANVAKEKGVISFGADWIKDKGKKFDLHLMMHNENGEKGIIVYLSDMSCHRGARMGTLKYTFFNTGERTIDFRPGQSKDFNMVCDTGEGASGAFQVTVSKVYENPNMDGKTPGKILAKSLTWKQLDKTGPAGDVKKAEGTKSDEM